MTENKVFKTSQNYSDVPTFCYRTLSFLKEIALTFIICSRNDRAKKMSI